MGLLNDWKNAKKEFEKETGKKKPSKKIGPIRTSTGIEDALKKLEGAKNQKDFDTAMKAFRLKKEAYQKLCSEAVKDKDSEEYKFQLNKLIIELESLEGAAQMTRGKLPK